MEIANGEYQANVNQADFQTGAEAARGEINRCFAQRTKDKIQDIVGGRNSIVVEARPLVLGGVSPQERIELKHESHYNAGDDSPKSRVNCDHC